MGQSSAQLEADIERRRNALGARVSRLERRVREDVQSARNWRSERVDELKSSVNEMESEALDAARGVVTSDAGSETAVAHHPGALVAASATGGFLLGLKRSGDSEADHEQHRNASQAQPAGLTGLLADTVRAVLTAQTGALVETALDAGTSGLKSVASEITGIGASDRGEETRDSIAPETGTGRGRARGSA